MSQVWESTTLLAVPKPSGDKVIEHKNASGYERKNMNCSRRMKLEYAEQIENHQYRKD